MGFAQSSLQFSGTSKTLWKPIVFAPFGFYGFRYLKTPMKTNGFYIILFYGFQVPQKPYENQ